MQNQPSIEQRKHGMGQNFVHLDHRPSNTVKAAVLDGPRQADAKDLQQTAHFIGQVMVLLSKAFRVLKRARTPCASRLFM